MMAGSSFSFSRPRARTAGSAWSSRGASCRWALDLGRRRPRHRARKFFPAANASSSSPPPSISTASASSRFRRTSGAPSSAADADRYQTVFAREPGAVAAPTAGLHFTPAILARVPHVFVTLHVGAGTFKPVQAEHITDHAMHRERFEISPAAAEAIRAAGRHHRHRHHHRAGPRELRRRGPNPSAERLHGHLHPSPVPIPRRPRLADQFPSPEIHAADARKRLRRARVHPGGLRGGHPRALPVFLLWRLHVDFAVKSRKQWKAPQDWRIGAWVPIALVSARFPRRRTPAISPGTRPASPQPSARSGD